MTGQKQTGRSAKRHLIRGAIVLLVLTCGIAGIRLCCYKDPSPLEESFWVGNPIYRRVFCSPQISRLAVYYHTPWDTRIFMQPVLYLRKLCGKKPTVYWLVDPQRRQAMRLSYFGLQGDDLVWRPDGQRVAFTFLGGSSSSGVPYSQIAVVDAVTGRIVEIVDGGWTNTVRGPTWSSDGRFFAWMETRLFAGHMDNGGVCEMK